MSYGILLSILKIGVVCFFLNIPFGMLRSRVKSYGLLWFFCIHAPIPIAVIMRKAASLEWGYVVIFLLFSIAGQIAGKKIALHYFPPKSKTTTSK